MSALASRIVTVDGRRVEVIDVGTSRPGDPVIVLLTGAGDTLRSWLPVQTLLSRGARVVGYERSGVGDSDGGSPRTLDGMLAELDGVLDAVATGLPVLLVGHSFGALLARVQAVRHPDRVAGLVLLDATPDQLGSDPLRRIGYRVYVEGTALLRAVLPGLVFGALVSRNLLPYYPDQRPFTSRLDREALAEWRRALKAIYLGAGIDEMRAVLPGAAEAARELGTDRGDARERPTSLGDLPVALLTSGTYGQGWISMHDSIARRYTNSSHEHSGDRIHNVHMRHVGLTVQTVRSVLAATRLTS